MARGAGNPTRIESMVDEFDDRDDDYDDDSTADPSGDSPSDDDADPDRGGDSDAGAAAGGADDDADQDDPAAVKDEPDKADPRSEMRALPNGLLQDKQGNLIHPKTGQIIARAGSERRLFERGQRMQTELEQRGNRIQQLEHQLNETRVLNDMPRELNLSTEDLRVGLPLVSEFIKNPVEGARKIIEMVAGMGHNISEIFGNNAGDTIEMRAVARMLDERLKPLQELQTQRTQAAKDVEQRTAAQSKVREFFDSHENAEMHAEVINDLIGRRWQGGDESFTPEKAYYELRVYAAQHGLDWNKPLKPQLEHQASASNGRPSQPDSTSRGPRSLPNGHRGNTSQRSVRETEYADPMDSWEDIIRRSMPR